LLATRVPGSAERAQGKAGTPTTSPLAIRVARLVTLALSLSVVTWRA
jgi:hypothetical protein